MNSETFWHSLSWSSISQLIKLIRDGLIFFLFKIKLPFPTVTCYLTGAGLQKSRVVLLCSNTPGAEEAERCIHADVAGTTFCCAMGDISPAWSLTCRSRLQAFFLQSDVRMVNLKQHSWITLNKKGCQIKTWKKCLICFSVENLGPPGWFFEMSIFLIFVETKTTDVKAGSLSLIFCSQPDGTMS